MKFTVSKSALSRELGLLAPIADRKTEIMPILSTVKMEAEGSSLRLTTANTESSLSASIEAKVEQSGTVCIPAKRLSGFVSSLPEGEVSVSVGERMGATIRMGRLKARIFGIDPAGFPELPQPPEQFATINAAAFSKQLQLVEFAILDGESRSFPNGALFSLADGRLVLAATDGHRMAWTQAEAPGEGKAIFVVPMVGIPHVKKLAEESDSFSVSVSDNNIFFVAGSRSLAMHKIAGSFPNYEGMLPKGYPTTVLADRGEFKSVLDRIIQFADEKSRIIKLTIQGAEISVLASSVDSGEAEEIVSAEGGPETPLVVGINATYVLDVLRRLTSEKVEIRLAESGPIEVREPQGADYRCVIAQVRAR